MHSDDPVKCQSSRSFITATFGYCNCNTLVRLISRVALCGRAVKFDRHRLGLSVLISKKHRNYSNCYNIMGIVLCWMKFKDSLIQSHAGLLSKRYLFFINQTFGEYNIGMLYTLTFHLVRNTHN